MAGLLKQFIFDHPETLEEVGKIMEHAISYLEPDELRSGARRFEPCDGKALQPFLNTIINEARGLKLFPLKTEMRIMHPTLVMAPALNSRSTSYTHGIIHRDLSNVDKTGVYTFVLFLDDVTPDNGAIKMWPKSKNCPHDRRSPKRVIKKSMLEDRILHGPRGTVCIWDARLLHQSLPNRTNKLRRTLVWMVNSKKQTPVDRT
jgi:hypothetical protein